MKKRTVKIGDYNTAGCGWTLTSYTLSDPEQKTTYVEKTGGDGTWDLSTVLTDGIPRYKDRTLTATFECSKGTRDTRERLISDMVNTLDGLVWPIVLPDHPEHYLAGRVHVKVKQNSLAYAAVEVSATCEPWFYSSREKVVEVTEISATKRSVQLVNNGRRAVSPSFVVGGASLIRLWYGDLATTLKGAGVYEWPVMVLTPGAHTLEYLGNTDSSLTIIYREAVLR